MKKLVLFLAIAALFCACDDKDKDKGNGLLDPNAMISLRAAKAQKSVAEAGTRAAEHLSALEIVKQTYNMYYYTKSTEGKDQITLRGFADKQRDYENERLLMWGIDIITQMGEYSPDFIESHGVVLTRIVYVGDIPRPDTIAYIPKKVLVEAQKIIKPAFDRGDYDLVYKTFDTAFTFIPVTGPEWLELEKQGLN